MKHRLLLIGFLMVFGTVFSQSQLPSIPLKTLDGKTIYTQELNTSDPIVISLWATWCAPCKNELDAISEVYEDWQEETRTKLYAVSVDDARTVKRVKPLVYGKDWDFEFLLDTNNDFKRALGAVTIPLTLVVKDGRIVYRHRGYTPGSEDELYEAIKKHLD